MKTYDAKTVLYNLSYDLKNMLDNNRDSTEVMSHIRSKLNFLTRNNNYEVIKWWDQHSPKTSEKIIYTKKELDLIDIEEDLENEKFY